MSRRSGITIARLTGTVAPLLHRGLIRRRATVTRHLLVPIPLLLVIAAEAGVVAMVAVVVVVTVAADPAAEEATAVAAGIAAEVAAVTAVAVAAAADLMEVV